MRSPKAGMSRIVLLSRRLAAVGSLALLLAGCSTSAATPTSAPTATPELTSVPPTSVVIVVMPTPPTMPTPTDTPTAAPSVVTPPPTATAVPKVVPTAPPAATPKPTPTPLPALAIGLCTGAQLSLSITSWVGDPGADPIYAHVTATNVSSASCNIRGASEAQILDASGGVIADAGSGAATVKSSDSVYALAPNGTVNTIVQWGNWCKPAPTQNLKIAMVEPFGLGRISAPANGVAKVPACSASGSATVVSSEAWLP
jgi:hypothetical protein